MTIRGRNTPLLGGCSLTLEIISHKLRVTAPIHVPNDVHGQNGQVERGVEIGRWRVSVSIETKNREVMYPPG